MRYLEHKEFSFDPVVFRRSDTVTALKIHAEFVLKQSARPGARPRFFEVNRADQQIDPLWHMPVTERTTFSRNFEVPCITTFDQAVWTIRKQGQMPKQKYTFWMAHLHLMPTGANPDERELDPIRLDYFPQRGDMIFHVGYRLMIVAAVPDPTAYWGQTNVWLGITAHAMIVPEGDARPVVDASQPVPAELPGAKAMEDWPGEPPTGPVPHSHP